MKKPKKKGHKLAVTMVRVEWCKACGYMHAPELELELWPSEAKKHHKSPYKK